MLRYRPVRGTRCLTFDPLRRRRKRPLRRVAMRRVSTEALGRTKATWLAIVAVGFVVVGKERFCALRRWLCEECLFSATISWESEVNQTSGPLDNVRMSINLMELGRGCGSVVQPAVPPQGAAQPRKAEPPMKHSALGILQSDNSPGRTWQDTVERTHENAVHKIGVLKPACTRAESKSFRAIQSMICL